MKARMFDRFEDPETTGGNNLLVVKFSDDVLLKVGTFKNGTPFVEIVDGYFGLETTDTETLRGLRDWFSRHVR